MTPHLQMRKLSFREIAWLLKVSKQSEYLKSYLSDVQISVLNDDVR